MRYSLLICLVCRLGWAGLNVGDKVPDFSLKSLEGSEFALKNTLNTAGAVAVVFMATKCPYSNLYNERFNETFETLNKLTPKKAVMVAVNSNDTEPAEEVKSHAEKNKFKFSIYKDENHKVADLFGAQKTPEVFLISANQEVVYHGRIDDDNEGKNIQRKDLAQAAQELISGKPISVKETRAFGCSIKRK